jgi:3-(3-hydroxy-phenyl)propionate hydroxylase
MSSTETKVQIQSRRFDVIIVGYGPTGLVLASLLGERGHRVAVVERWRELYGKPRLTHIDGETARLISLAADAEEALRDSWTTPHYYWLNGKGRLLIDVAAGNTRKALWDDHMSVHQPHFESAIHERIQTHSKTVLLRGYAATSIQQSATNVKLICQPWRPQGGDDAAMDAVSLEATYLVGADGSNSFVRNALGVDRIDFGFNERWLCVDTEPLKALPSKFDQNAMQVCDPRRGYMFMPIGKSRQRFEFALKKNEDTSSMSRPEAAWRLLKEYHDLGPEDVRIVRNLVYTFECRMANTWRVGRVFLSGDAAHTNPPYLGQGACSGMRDASNLAWKLDLVLRGLAEDALLDTYEVERRPHAQKLMLDSRALGMVANTANPVKAAIRDLLFRLKLAPKPKFPVLLDGVLARDKDGELVKGAGSLSGQGRVSVEGTLRRFDEHVGFNFSVVSRRSEQEKLPPDLLLRLQELGVRWVALDSAGDEDGRYGAMLDELCADAMVIRPDFVFFGSSTSDELEWLLTKLVDALCLLPTSTPHPAGPA